MTEVPQNRALEADSGRQAANCRRKVKEPDQGQDLGLEDTAPADEPVEGRLLVAELERALGRYVVFPHGGTLVVALWIVMTHLVERLDLMPRLLFWSPIRECGKTRALDVISYLVARPLKVSSISPACLFRTIEAGRPTVLFDEMDQSGINAEESGELRRLLNAGHSRATAWAYRAVGKDFRPKRFRVYCPMALAAIGSLPDTLESRCIRIAMRRRAPGETVERMRERLLAREMEPIRRRIARWALDHGPAIELAEPVAPEGLGDRAAENAEALLGIADELSVGDEAGKALLALAGGAESQEEHAGLMMLADLRDVLETEGGEVASHRFRDLLVAIEERPWASWRRGQSITSHGVSRLLAPFGIRTRNIRSPEGQVKGYVLDPPAEDVFRRYLTSNSVPYPVSPPFKVSQSSQAAPIPDETAILNPSRAPLGTDPRGASEPHQSRSGTIGTGQTRSVEKKGGYGTRRPVCSIHGRGKVRKSPSAPWTCRECERHSERVRDCPGDPSHEGQPNRSPAGALPPADAERVEKEELPAGPQSQSIDDLLARFDWEHVPGRDERPVPCRNCRGRRFSRHRGGGPFVCDRCHPIHPEMIAERYEVAESLAAAAAATLDPDTSAVPEIVPESSRLPENPPDGSTLPDSTAASSRA